MNFVVLKYTSRYYTQKLTSYVCSYVWGVVYQQKFYLENYFSQANFSKPRIKNLIMKNLGWNVIFY